jgi:hypothetical protein
MTLVNFYIKLHRERRDLPEKYLRSITSGITINKAKKFISPFIWEAIGYEKGKKLPSPSSFIFHQNFHEETKFLDKISEVIGF